MSDKTKYVCKKCSAGFPNNQALQKHLSDKKAHPAGALIATKACLPCAAATAAAKGVKAKK